MFPDIGTYVEIEGNEKEVSDVAQALGYKAADSLSVPYDNLHRDWQVSRGLPEKRFINFGNKRGRVLKSEQARTQILEDKKLGFG